MAEPTYVDLDQTGAEIQAILTRAENQREVLTADRTYYVATTGSDSNDGLSSGSPFATIQKAVDVVCSLDLSIYQATIQLADGTYTAGATLKSYVGALPPIIQGNATTPANVVVNDAGTDAFLLEVVATWRIANLRVLSVSNGVYVRNGGVCNLASVHFGACTGVHVFAELCGVITIMGSYTISGGGTVHINASYSGTIYTVDAGTVTISGTPSFSMSFARATSCSSIRYGNKTFSGSATGKRYDSNSNGVIFTLGGATYFPGSAAGTVSTGGQYV
jgi:hypothetical protein